MTYNSCILNGSTSSNRSLKIRKIVSCLTSGEVTTLSRWQEGFESPTGRHIETHYCLFRRSSDDQSVYIDHLIRKTVSIDKILVVCFNMATQIMKHWE